MDPLRDNSDDANVHPPSPDGPRDLPAMADDNGDAYVLRAEIVDERRSPDWSWHEVRPVAPPPVPAPRFRLAILLFVATCLSTLMAGMGDFTNPSLGWTGAILQALQYAMPVMIILTCHEMGHFLQAKRYGVRTSPPYFIPLPGSLLGTLGAVISMEPRIGHRRALFDIGISGPLAGLVPTFIFLIVGLQHSEFTKPIVFQSDLPRIAFGAPIVVDYLAEIIQGPTPANKILTLSPMAFAGWVGLLITSLNLMPIGQLDGGHVLYALLRKRAHVVATLLLYGAIFMVAFHWQQYWMWTVMLFLLILMGPRHPPTCDDDEPLGLVRTILGWLTLAFIVIGFTPTPIIQ